MEAPSWGALSEIPTEQPAPVRVVRIARELDLAAQEDFETILSDGVDSAIPIIVDLSSCPYLDSTGLATLVKRHRNTERMAVVVSKGSPVDRVFELTKLHRILNVFPTLEAARVGIAAARAS